MSIAAVSRREDLNLEFEELFHEHFQFVYRTAYTVTGSRQDAEDVAQTIFLRLMRREVPPALKHGPKAYLYRAAVNESLNIIRSRKREKLTDDMGLLEILAAPSAGNRDNNSDLELQHSVVEAMAQLHPFAAEILVLRYEHNYSDAEIAGMLGKSRGMIAVTLYRARARLKKLLRSALGDKL